MGSRRVTGWMTLSRSNFKFWTLVRYQPRMGERLLSLYYLPFCLGSEDPAGEYRALICLHGWLCAYAYGDAECRVEKTNNSLCGGCLLMASGYTNRAAGPNWAVPFWSSGGKAILPAKAKGSPATAITIIC